MIGESANPIGDFGPMPSRLIVVAFQAGEIFYIDWETFFCNETKLKLVEYVWFCFTFEM